MQDPAETTRTEADEAVAKRVAEFSAALEAQNLDRVRELASGLRAPDLADVLELLGADERVTLIRALGASFNPEVLSELDAGVRDQLFETLPKDTLAQALSQLETDDAAYLLEGLDEAEKQDLLARLPAQDRVALERNLEYPEETAGRLMQTDFVAVPPFWTVGQVIDHMRETDDLPETFSDIFVVDPAYRVLGSVDLSRLLRTKRQVSIETIMDRDRHVISATADQEEIAREFERYDLKSAPVADEHGRLVGAVTVDDVVEVIQEETEEDLRRLAGVGDESLADSVVNTVRSRIQWLALNLVTAMLSASVIKLFDASIEQMVALAVLMPIVASMGGNAATQTMAVAVRALATRELGRVNARRVILREASVGAINGVVLAALLALVVFVVFGHSTLGFVIAAAMIFNLFAAALAGILIPIGLERLGFDPAVASGVFVTTVTDVVGFFAFLGLATLFLL